MRVCLPCARLSPTGTHSRPSCVQMSVSVAERQRCGTGNFTASFRLTLELILSLVFFHHLWCLRIFPLIKLLEINGAKRLIFVLFPSLEMNFWRRITFNHTQKHVCSQLRELFFKHLSESSYSDHMLRCCHLLRVVLDRFLPLFWSSPTPRWENTDPSAAKCLALSPS